MRTAILGGGGIGVCAALEIARNGYSVDIYEQDSEPLRRASRVNEGKIHQGFLYAKDSTKQTVRMLAQGALSFSACLSRWLDIPGDRFAASTPFVYAVAKESMVNIDDLRKHFTACCSIFKEMEASTGLRYLGRDEPASFRELCRNELESILDPSQFTGAFITSERSLDPRVVAQHLRDAALAEPLITFVGNSLVRFVNRSKSGYHVTFDNQGQQQAGPYDRVVNALWESRLAIDQSLGIEPSQRWIFRHKFGNRVNVRLTPDDLPSVTMVLGSFGDIVNFGDNGLYLSWYPFGMVDTCFDLQPPQGWTERDNATKFSIFNRSLQRWSDFCPKLRDIEFDLNAVDPASGVIFAWGKTDIDDPNSKLHTRYDIGIQSVDGYHSVNSGKYTMVPFLGLKVAERVLGKEN